MVNKFVGMRIENCSMADIDEIFRLYKHASAYQQSKKVVEWPEFERALVEKEVAEQRQWKLLLDGNIACNWVISFSDKQIWEEKDNDKSVYIHRIATNPHYRGRNFVKTIVHWAKDYSLKNNKSYIRLDTLGYNTGLIRHYTNAGFEFLGMFRLKNTEGLPGHYRDHPDSCLFEIKL